MTLSPQENEKGLIISFVGIRIKLLKGRNLKVDEK
jgi:hypothetical protein